MEYPVPSDTEHSHMNTRRPSSRTNKRNSYSQLHSTKPRPTSSVYSRSTMGREDRDDLPEVIPEHYQPLHYQEQQLHQQLQQHQQHQQQQQQVQRQLQLQQQPQQQQQQQQHQGQHHLQPNEQQNNNELGVEKDTTVLEGLIHPATKAARQSQSSTTSLSGMLKRFGGPKDELLGTTRTTTSGTYVANEDIRDCTMKRPKRKNSFIRFGFGIMALIAVMLVVICICIAVGAFDHGQGSGKGNGKGNGDNSSESTTISRNTSFFLGTITAIPPGSSVPTIVSTSNTAAPLATNASKLPFSDLLPPLYYKNADGSLRSDG
ncbi:hypothetical protein FQN57_003550 [Myotisia sp. PD_48]|nr:hypothetical protein FQN57_003550 [Myotisia sp. PD_48]